MNSAQLLNSEDCPKRQSLYLSGLERESLTVHQLLSRGVDLGLRSELNEPGKAAGDEVMRLCLSRPIENESSDLLGIAEHTSALAEIIVWCLRTGNPWQHPDPIKLGSETWTPSCWAIPGGLRRIVLCDRWDEHRALREMRDWQTLEGAIYGLPVTIIAVVLGAMRDGRRHGPLAKGWLHPQSQGLRFRKRDGTGFDGNWEPVFRENFDGSREDWIEAMSADDLMAETFVIHPAVEFDAEETGSIRSLAHAKLADIEKCSDTEPHRHLSRCFDSLHPCEFRQPCSFFKEPEVGKGFI